MIWPESSAALTIEARVLSRGYRAPRARSSIRRHPSAARISASTRSTGPTRSARSARQLKRDLKAGTTSINALLLDPPACLQTAKVLDILLAVPKIGKVKATTILDSCRVSPSKTFGGLTDRQRAELAARLSRPPGEGGG